MQVTFWISVFKFRNALKGIFYYKIIRVFFDECPRKGAFFRKFVEEFSNKGRTMVEQD